MQTTHPKKTVFGASMAVLALALSACGGNGGTSDSSASAAPKDENPVLSVPETTESESVQFKLAPGSITAGQDYHVAAYGGGFDGKTIDCSEEVASTDGKFGDKETSGSVQVKEPGKYVLVVSTEGHASACDDPNATTTIKVAPKLFLDGDLNADGAKTVNASPGKPFDVAVIMRGSDLPEGGSVPVDLTVRGPYSTEPELRAAQCSDDKIASEQTVQWTGKGTNRADNKYTTGKVTIDGTKGLYLVTAKSQKTEEVASVETECDNYQSALKVSTKGTSNGSSDSGNASPSNSKGTNALTPEKDKNKDHNKKK